MYVEFDSKDKVADAAPDEMDPTKVLDPIELAIDPFVNWELKVSPLARSTSTLCKSPVGGPKEESSEMNEPRLSVWSSYKTEKKEISDRNPD